MSFLLTPHTQLLNQAALGVLITFLIFVVSLLSRTHRSRMVASLSAAVALTYGAFFVSPLSQWALVACSSILIISSLRRLELDSGNTPSKSSPPSKSLSLILVAMLPVAGLLTYRLRSFSAIPLTWEATTMTALLAELQRPQSLWQILKGRLLWSDGILSAGETSLLFGMPSLILSREFGPSISLLRGVSVFWILGAVFTFALLFKRRFGGFAPYIATLVFGLNELILIYGRYGSSIAGTMFAVVLAILLAFRLAERGEFLCAFCFSLALYLATLGYGAARISVLILLLVFFLTIPFSSHSRGRRWGIVLIVVGVVGSVSFLEARYNRHNNLLKARAEQIFYMSSQNQLLFTSTTLAAREDSKAPLSWQERVGVASELIQKATGPQLWKLLNPFSPEKRSQFPFQDDPPFIKIFAPSLFPWMLLGFWAVWRPGRRHIAITCLSLVVLGVIPLVLTNRVDSYRAIFLTIPLSIWITVGISEFIDAAGRLTFVRGLICLALGLGLACGLIRRTHDLYSPPQPISALEGDIAYAVSRVPGPLTAILNLDHKVESTVAVNLFTRFQDTGALGGLLPDNLAASLTNESIDANPAAFQRAVNLLDMGQVLILAPAQHYKLTSGRLRALGHVVRTSGAPRFSVFVISKPEVSVDLDRASDKLLPSTEALEPLHQPQAFNHHIPIDLTSLTPLTTHHDLAPPKRDRTFSGSPPGWRNLRFTHFMGTHATTYLEYAVPDGAEGFQSWIGISPGVGACTKGSAQVIVRNQEDTLLYRSPLLESNQNPVFLSIPLGSVSRLRIQITDAGDSRDCDHVDFGDPAFMVPKADPPRE